MIERSGETRRHDENDVRARQITQAQVRPLLARCRLQGCDRHAGLTIEAGRAEGRA